LLVLVARRIYQNGCFNVATSCNWSSCKSSNSIDGWDSVLSILQMPGGVPVATVALEPKMPILPHKSLEVTINVLDKIIL
jgi:hypothetical protein